MTQFYIGCKQVEAWEHAKDGKPGYAVKYPDGYISWSPKAIFENAYLPMGFYLKQSPEGESLRMVNQSQINQEMVDRFIHYIKTETRGKTTIVHAQLANGFELVESSACVDPANYDEKIGEEICVKRIQDKVWHLLGFLLQTARQGVATREGFTGPGHLGTD